MCLSLESFVAHIRFQSVFFVSQNNIVKSRVTQVHQQKSSRAEATLLRAGRHGQRHREQQSVDSRAEMNLPLCHLTACLFVERDDSPSALLLSLLYLGSCVRVCRDWRLRHYHNNPCGFIHPSDLITSDQQCGHSDRIRFEKLGWLSCRLSKVF